jgi:hypothetical protein
VRRKRYQAVFTHAERFVFGVTVMAAVAALYGLWSGAISV